MKKLTLIVLILTTAPCLAQHAKPDQKQAVIQVIEQFFESLNTQDTVQFKSTLFPEGQVWTIINDEGSRSYRSRLFKEDIKNLVGDHTMEETAISYQINIHQGMAMAWVPYTFKYNGEFSHCGVDIFTLVETAEGWKIMQVAYTVDSIGCEELE